MNKWNDIVLSLIDCKNKGLSESEYQSKIEEQFKFLGWSVYSGCIESKPILPIGNSKYIIPDLVLKKDNIRVLPIEIKEPNNRIKKRQEEQLFSYMLQLDLRIGVYIGEKIQLYYNSYDDKDRPHCVLSVDYNIDNPNGILLCELLSYETFNLNNLEEFCKKIVAKERYKLSLHHQFEEIFAPEKGEETIKKFIKLRLIEDCQDEAVLDEAINSLKIHIELPSSSKNQNKIISQKSKKKIAKYSLNGSTPMYKTKFVLEALRLYVKKFPTATYEDIEATFPKSIQGGYGVVRKMSDLQEYIESGSNIMGRFSSTPQEILTSADGISFAVCNQWDYNNFPRFVSILKTLKWKVKEYK